MKTEDIKMMQERFDDIIRELDAIDGFDYENHVLTEHQLMQFDKAYKALWDIRADLYGATHWSA